MILVDSSVWIDDFRGGVTPQADMLDALHGTEPIATGDLILTEVLQGFVSDRDFNQARKLLTSLVVVDLVGQDVAVKAAKSFRVLRAQGTTVRKTIDTLIATRCIESRLSLLHSDRDFYPFVEDLGLRSAMLGIWRSTLALNRGEDAQRTRRRLERLVGLSCSDSTYALLAPLHTRFLNCSMLSSKGRDSDKTSFPSPFSAHTFGFSKYSKDTRSVTTR